MKQFVVIIGLFARFTLAAPPDIECINVQSFGEAYFSRSTKEIDDPLIILVGDSEDSDPKSTWEVWEHPDVLAYIKQRKILVTYVDKDTVSQSSFLVYRPDPEDVLQSVSIFEHLRPETVPMVIYYPGGRGYDSRLSGDQLSIDPDTAVKWLRDPEWKKKEQKEQELRLLRRIAEKPDDFGIRLQLIELHSSEHGRSLSAISLIPWMLIHNEEWFEYERKASKQQITEDQFRKGVFVEIMTARLYLQLFKDKSSRYPNVEFDTWMEWAERDVHGFWSGIVPVKTNAAWGWYHALAPFIKAIQSGEGSERDRFIVRALLAEDEEWNTLIQKYTD